MFIEIWRHLGIEAIARFDRRVELRVEEPMR